MSDVAFAAGGPPPEAWHGRTPLAASCRECGYTWAVAWLPAPAKAIPSSKSAYRCPWCLNVKTFIAEPVDSARIAPVFSADRRVDP